MAWDEWAVDDTFTGEDRDQLILCVGLQVYEVYNSSLRN